MQGTTSWLLAVTTRQPDFGYSVVQGWEKHMHVSCQDYYQIVCKAVLSCPDLDDGVDGDVDR